MKAKELSCKDLMIGDWVSYHGIVNRVAPADFDFHHKKWFDEIEPILLTAEILENNGFTRFGTDYILKGEHFGLDNPSIPSNYLDNYWLRISIKAVHIKYVHQLQHALRLCGIDKTIEL